MRSFLVTSLLSTLVFLAPVNGAQAVGIAVFDTGSDPGTCRCPMNRESFDFLRNDNTPDDESDNNHGNAVANVAFNSGNPINITAIKVFDAGFNTTADIMSSATQYVAGLNNVQVAVFSGAQESDTPIQDLQAVTNSGKIAVFQAGNKAFPSPSGDGASTKVSALGGRGMVVGGLTADGRDIAVFSNRAGFAADYYIMAHTESLITGSNGTSMAAPRVGAAAATVLDRHGFLAPEQVVAILFETADDLGAPGVDQVYGHGALNLDAALSAAGAGEIPTVPGGDDGGGSGGGAGIAVAALVVGVGAAVWQGIGDKDEELERTIMVDKFGRAFSYNLADHAVIKGERPSVWQLFNSHNADFESVVMSQTENSYTQAWVNNATVNPFQFTSGDKVEDTYISFLNRTELPDAYYAMSMNANLSGDFGALSYQNRKTGNTTPRFSNNDLFTTPVLGYSSMGTAFMYGWNQSAVNHRFAVSMVDEQEDYGQVSNSVLFESSFDKEDYRLGMQMGALIENGSFLGGSRNGAFGVDETATYYLGLNGSYDLSDKITLLGGYFQGMSSVDDSSNSLISDISGVRTEGYALGMLVDDLFSPKGSFGLSYSSPMQTTSGSATLTLPVSQNQSTGAIGFESSNLSFETGDREQVIEAYYNYDVNRNNSIFTHFSHTRNPLTNLDASSNNIVFVGWRHSLN